LGAQGRSLCLFTGRFRWPALDAGLGRGTALELHLPELSASQAIMLMDNLPRLRNQELATKIAMLRKVGGHPHSIELLEGWLASGRVSDLLHDASLDNLLREQWEGYFLQALLARLTPAQREALARLSIFRTALDKEEFAYAGVDDAAVRAWLDLSLVQREQGAAAVDLAPEMQALLELLPEAERRQFETQVRYTIHPVVRDSLLAQQSAEDRQALHRWAAAYYGRPFVEMARRMVRPGAQVTEEQLAAFARSHRGVVGRMVARTDDLAQARAAMARALAWQHHLFAAADYEPAGEIVTAVYDILDRWGQRDRAKALLRGSIATLAGFSLAVAQGNLANLLMDEGKLDEALATYDAVYATFAALNARQQMATALAQKGSVLQDMGNYQAAIDKYSEAHEIFRVEGREDYQAAFLHQLSMLYRLTEDYPTALARKVGNEALVATTLHEQGLIYNKMARAAAAGQAEAAADATPAAHRAQAFDRFQQSLAIGRRIGDKAGAADSLGELGKLLRDAGQMREAIAAFTECAEIYRRTNNPVKQGIILEFLGSVHELQGQYADALEKYEQALALLERAGAVREAENNRRHIARVRAKLGGG
jgi:tetratricopeptide (TPR) repeat protein